MQPWGTITHSFIDGTYSIDVDRMWKLFFDRRRTENYTKKNFAPEVPADTRLLGPDVHNVEVDWEGAAKEARGYADNQTATVCYKLTASQLSGSSLRQMLKTEYGSLESARNEFTSKLHEVGRKNSEALSSNIKHWGWAVSGATIVRDASTTVLGVGAVVLTGGGAAGAALAFTGVGAGLTGVAKAQDCEKHLTTQQAVGVAVVAGSVDFVTTIVTGGISKEMKLAWAGKAVLAFFVKVPTKTVTSIMMADMTRQPGEKSEGLAAHAWDAMGDWAAEEAVGGIAGKLFRQPQVKAYLRKVAVAGAALVKNGAADMKGGAAAKLIRDGAQNTVKKAIKAVGSAAVPTAASLASAGPPRGSLPESVVRQPIHGGAALETVVLNAIMSPLSSR